MKLFGAILCRKEVTRLILDASKASGDMRYAISLLLGILLLWLERGTGNILNDDVVNSEKVEELEVNVDEILWWHGGIIHARTQSTKLSYKRQ